MKKYRGPERHTMKPTSKPLHVGPARDILAHWSWALPVLLIVAALSMRQIDLYPPTVRRILLDV